MLGWMVEDKGIAPHERTARVEQRVRLQWAGQRVPPPARTCASERSTPVHQSTQPGRRQDAVGAACLAR